MLVRKQKIGTTHHEVRRTRIFEMSSTVVPGVGLEPTLLAKGAFETPESTNSSTQAFRVKIFYHLAVILQPLIRLNMVTFTNSIRNSSCLAI